MLGGSAGALLLRGVPSSASEEALVSSSSVKWLELPGVACSDGGDAEEEDGCLLLEQGKGSGEDREQLGACLNLPSWAAGGAEGKPRELSPTAPKWPEEACRLTVRSMPL